MLQKQSIYTQKISVAAPPIDLADGRFETRAAALRVLFAVGMLLSAGLSLWAVLWILPEYEDPNAAQIVGVMLFVGIGLVSVGFGVAAVRLQFRAWGNYQRFLDDMRDAYHAAYTEHDGQEIEQQVRVNEININDIRDMLTLVVYVHMTGQTSISKLSGPLLVNDGRRMVSLGRMTDYGAELAAKRLEKAGVLLNAGTGKGRRLPNGDLEALIVTLIRSWDGKEGEE